MLFFLLSVITLVRGQTYYYTSSSSYLNTRSIYSSTTIQNRFLTNSLRISATGYVRNYCSTGHSPQLTISVVPTDTFFSFSTRYVTVYTSSTGFTGGSSSINCSPTTSTSNSWLSAGFCVSRAVSSTTYGSSTYYSITITPRNVSPSSTNRILYNGVYYNVGVQATWQCALAPYLGTRQLTLNTFSTSSSRITRHYCYWSGCTFSYYLYDSCTSSSLYALTLQVSVIPAGFSSSRYIDIHVNNRLLKRCTSTQLGTLSYTSWTNLRNCATMRLSGYTSSNRYGYLNVRLSGSSLLSNVYSVYELGVQLNLACRRTTTLSGYTTSYGTTASTSSSVTLRPTFPTRYPTLRPTTSSGGAIAGIVIGNIFFYICCFCVIRYVCCLNNSTTSSTKVIAPVVAQPVVTGVVMTSTTTTTTVQQNPQPQIVGTPMGQPMTQPAVQQPPIQQPMHQPIQQPVQQQAAPAETPGYQYNYYNQPQYDYNTPGPTPQQPGYTPGAPGAPGYVQQPYAYASLQGPPTQGAPVYGQVAQSGNPGGPVDAYNPGGAPPATAPGYMGPGGMAPSTDAPPPGGVQTGAPPMYNYAPPPSTGGGMAEAPPGYSEAVEAPPAYNDMGAPPAYGGDAPPPAYGGAPPAYGAPGGYAPPPAYGGEGQGGEGAATTGAAPRYG